MKLPDFDEFLASLDGKKVQADIAKTTYEKPVSIEFNPDDREAFRAALGQIWRDATERAILASLVYLRAYHEWI